MENQKSISTINRRNNEQKSIQQQESNNQFLKQLLQKQENQSFSVGEMLSNYTPKHSIQNKNQALLINSAQLQQIKLNKPNIKKRLGSFSLIKKNRTPPPLAIQSQPKALITSFSSYFIDASLSMLSKQKQQAVFKIMNLIIRMSSQKSIKRRCFKNFQQLAEINSQKYQKSLLKRQLNFMNLVKFDRLNFDIKSYDRAFIYLNNKLIVSLQPQLVRQKKQQIINSNIQILQSTINLQQQSINKPNENECQIQGNYKFNFKIHQLPPLELHSSIIESNSKIKPKD